MRILLPLMVLLTLNGSTYSQQLDNEQLLDLMQSQRYNEAAALITSSYPEGSNDAKIIARLAYCTYMAGNLAEAEKNYKLLLERDSTNKTVLFNLAGINNKRGNTIQTNFYYQKILKIDSTNFTVYKQLAALAERMNEAENYGFYAIYADTDGFYAKYKSKK